MTGGRIGIASRLLSETLIKFFFQDIIPPSGAGRMQHRAKEPVVVP